MSDHRPRLFSGARSNNLSYDFAFSATTVPSFKKLFSSRVKAVCGDSRCGEGRRVSTAYASTSAGAATIILARTASRLSIHLQQPDDAHAMSIGCNHAAGIRKKSGRHA
jgi:hypothetical protein